MKLKNFGGIILAAGKGKRMNSKKINKVILPLGGKPMIIHTVSLLHKLHLEPIIIVVGFAKKSVIDVLKNENVHFAYQKNQLGVAHALFCGVKKLPNSIENVLVVNGDDSAFYKKEMVQELIDRHLKSKAVMSFFTTIIDQPSGLGRIKRDKKRKVVGIIEETDATTEERKIKEINVGCYVFQVDFLKKYLLKIKKSKVTGEYYLTELVALAIPRNLRVETMRVNNLLWRGVNTKEELKEAEKMFFNILIN